MDKITIEMPPFGKARPRVTRDGTRTYMPTEYQNKREQLRLLYQAAGGEVDPERAIALSITFVLRMPKSWSKKKKAEGLEKHKKQIREKKQKTKARKQVSLPKKKK